VSASYDQFDYLTADTWSVGWINEILRILGYVRDGKLHVYWCLPDKEIQEGLVLIENDANIRHMAKASRTVKTLVLFVDHTNFLRQLRKDILVTGPALPPVISPMKIPRATTPAKPATSSSSSIVQLVQKEVRYACDSDTDTDNEFVMYDSDFDVEDGDDDLFSDNVDKSVSDHNEKEVCVENEDEEALEDDDLNMEAGRRLKLMKKLTAFNPEVDMDNPSFKRGMVFSGVEELRKALAAYSIRNRVHIKKTLNDRRRLNAQCAPGCCWMLRASADEKRSGGFTIKAYEGIHTCEGTWPLKAISSKILTEKFMHEFRDNQKLGLQSFAAKVLREFKMCPNRFKLSRARKAALLNIHGDEESQFGLLLDYGQELRRSNPGSKFFLTTNSVNDPNTGEEKQHLTIVYWSYDACKRGFLAGCRPFICLDGCHIKTRYKGQLLTTVGVDRNDCIYPIALD
jgi:hypothetical protein